MAAGAAAAAAAAAAAVHCCCHLVLLLAAADPISAQAEYDGHLDLDGFLEYLDTRRLVEVGPADFERAVKAAGS